MTAKSSLHPPWLTRDRLLPVDSEQLAQIADRCRSLEDADEPSWYRRESLPSSVVGWCERVRRSGAGLLSGIPIPAELPLTPADEWAQVPEPGLDSILNRIAREFGSVAVVSDKVRKSRIYDIFPIRADNGSEFGSSAGALAWHTEDAFHPTPPDWIALLCLRGASEAHTRLAHLRDIVATCPDVTSFTYEFLVDESYESFGSKLRWSIAVVEPGSTRLRFDPAYMRAFGVEAEKMIESVAAVADSRGTRVELTAGDLLIFDNRVLMHARTAYRPEYAGADRWLKRAVIYSRRVPLTRGEVQGVSREAGLE